MLSLESVANLLNDTGYKYPPFILKWRDIYYRMSLHTTGVCPSFRNLRFDDAGGGTYILEQGLTYPIGWVQGRYDWIFDTFLLNRHPRENEVNRQWRKSQYKPYTQAPFQQVISKAAGTIFADSNYSITIDDKEDNDYIHGNNFHGKDLVCYISSQLQTICEDPNSFFVTIPKEPGYATTTKRIEPEIYNIPTRDIIYMSNDEIIFNILDIAWLVNNFGYFRFQKDNSGKYFHIDEAQGGYYGHVTGSVPKVQAGGMWNTQGFYDSYLKAAQAFADEFVGDKSAAQLVNKDSTHPYVTMASDDCPACDHTGKIQYCGKCHSTADNCSCDHSAEDTLKYLQVKSCGKCGGTGQISWNPADIKVAPPEDMGNDLIKIINPDIGVAEFHKKNVEDCYNGIMRALHQWYIDEAQSGTAKDIDRQDSYLFLQKMSDGLFHLIEQLIINILKIRTVSTANNMVTIEPEKYTIVKPTQFAIKSENDLLLEYDAANKAEIPPFILSRQLVEYVDKLYGGDCVMKKKVIIISQIDSLSAVSISDKIAMVSAGAIDRRDLQKSTELPRILDNIIRVQGSEWFMNASFDDINSMFLTEFAKIPPVKLESKTSVSVNDKVSA